MHAYAHTHTYTYTPVSVCFSNTEEFSFSLHSQISPFPFSWVSLLIVISLSSSPEILKQSFFYYYSVPSCPSLGHWIHFPYFYILYFCILDINLICYSQFKQFLKYILKLHFDYRCFWFFSKTSYIRKSTQFNNDKG